MLETNASTPRWTEREAELLAATLRLLQEHGYERLTVAAVASKAKASKATVYRRWPSKAQLVSAAFVESIRTEMVIPHSGSLRADLLQVGTVMREHARQHARSTRAVLSEMSRIPQLGAALTDGVINRQRVLMSQILSEAASREEIDAEVINHETLDLLSGYLAYRFLMPGPPPTAETVRALVDDVLIPSLTRPRNP